jgi:KaiC/GvpD/RAD55 family RecA-like ATPase
MEDNVIKKDTGISTIYWNEKENGKFKTANIGVGDDTKTISWFDELFRGGIRIFDDKVTTMLIKGPPGSGKSTMALELCYRLGIKHSYKSLYISIESDKEQIISNIKESFCWEKALDKEHYISTLNDKGDSKDTHLGIWNPKKLQNWIKISEIVDSAFNTIANLYKIKFSKSIYQDIKFWFSNRGMEADNKFQPNVLVVDSLNVVPINERAQAFQHFLKISQKRKETRLMIFILDGTLSADNNPFWDYFCDIIIELNYNKSNDYYMRTFEIIKARYQEHVWGTHQLKIYPKDKNTQLDDDIKLLRAHPFRNEGGIFIFPSIHYYLSRYKRKPAKDNPNYDETYPPSLNKILLSASTKENDNNDGISTKINNSGFPNGRCTAFIGCRGGHKSHLGYLHLLNRLCMGINQSGYGESVLVISLRDDEKMTESTMKRILDNEYPYIKCTIQKFKEDGNLEILYFPPGNISPEEFLHRIFVSIHRMKQRNKHLTVMFNSLDQLNARFPLCAKQEIFIPSIIQLLIGEEVTSIFIAVDEEGQPKGQYGLLPMADLIISFHKYRMRMDTYLGIFNNDKAYNFSEYYNGEKNPEEIYREEVILSIERYAGGRKAGTKGILELGNDLKEIKDERYRNKKIINFFPLTDRFDFKKLVKIE